MIGDRGASSPPPAWPSCSCAQRPTPGVAGEPDGGETFGWSLAAGEFGRTDALDLAIGDPTSECVTTLYGRDGGLSAARSRAWTQDSPGLPGSRSPGDHFGWTLAP